MRRIEAHHDKLDALGRELLSSRLADVASDAADFEFLGQDWVGEDGCNDGASLVARGAEDGENLGHDEL